MIFHIGMPFHEDDRLMQRIIPEALAIAMKIKKEDQKSLPCFNSRGGRKCSPVTGGQGRGRPARLRKTLNMLPTCCAIAPVPFMRLPKRAS